jgi:hypothetical protein
MPTIHSYMRPLELIFMSENANAANFAHPARLQVRQDSQVLKHLSNVGFGLQGSIPGPWLVVTGAGIIPARLRGIAKPQP